MIAKITGREAKWDSVPAVSLGDTGGTLSGTQGRG